MNNLKVMTQLTDEGGVIIPTSYRQALGINSGDEVVMFLVDDEIRILPRKIALERAQNLVGHYAKSRCLSDELIKERRFD
jgi:AbrB family looped-hinge helix DNA binding protein